MEARIAQLAEEISGPRERYLACYTEAMRIREYFRKANEFFPVHSNRALTDLLSNQEQQKTRRTWELARSYVFPPESVEVDNDLLDNIADKMTAEIEAGAFGDTLPDRSTEEGQETFAGTETDSLNTGAQQASEADHEPTEPVAILNEDETEQINSEKARSDSERKAKESDKSQVGSQEALSEDTISEAVIDHRLLNVSDINSFIFNERDRLMSGERSGDDSTMVVWDLLNEYNLYRGMIIFADFEKAKSLLYQYLNGDTGLSNAVAGLSMTTDGAAMVIGGDLRDCHNDWIKMIQTVNKNLYELGIEKAYFLDIGPDETSQDGELEISRSKEPTAFEETGKNRVPQENRKKIIGGIIAAIAFLAIVLFFAFPKINSIISAKKRDTASMKAADQAPKQNKPMTIGNEIKVKPKRTTKKHKELETAQKIPNSELSGRVFYATGEIQIRLTEGPKRDGKTLHFVESGDMCKIVEEHASDSIKVDCGQERIGWADRMFFDRPSIDYPILFVRNNLPSAVRSCPSLSCGVIHVLNNGDKVTIEKGDGEWAKIFREPDVRG